MVIASELLARDLARINSIHAVEDPTVELGTGLPKSKQTKKIKVWRKFESQTENLSALVWASEAAKNGTLDGADE